MLKTTLKSDLRVLSLLIAGALLGGCATPPPVTTTLLLSPSQMVVQSGDTLYSIAQSYGVSVKGLMAVNGLRTSHIYPGQILTIPKETPADTNPQKKPVPGPQAEIQEIPLQPLEGEQGLDHDLTAEIASAPELVSTSGAPEVSLTPEATPVGGGKLSWPLKGDVVSQFNKAKRLDGIRIKGTAGDVVRASKGGEVLIAQKNYENFGNILVIKSPDNSLVAYGMLDKFKVSPGTMIKQGEAIGSVGKSGELYFEVRKIVGNSKTPINPLPLLSETAPAA